MPRLLTADNVYSGSMDDCFNDYITESTAHQQQALQLQIHQQVSNAVSSNTITTYSNNYVANAQEISVQNLHEQQIHTISSSDAEEFVGEQSTMENEITNMSSEEGSDFQGFDDFTTTNSSALINDTSVEDFDTAKNCLKRQSQANFADYDDDLGLEAIEVEDDDDEEIAIGDDGKLMCMSEEKITKNSAIYRCRPYAPNKRKKHEIDKNYNVSANISTQLLTPPDQIVEVNSDSTTNSLKQKRQQINNKFQLSFCQKQNPKASYYPNKCSSESTSEFPVSSPSNPQQPRGGKYPARPPLLKNTLPADSFERQLAIITACNPQMTLAEKIQSWDCEEELSDVEDVNKFDEEFKRLEKQKLQMKQKEKTGRFKNTEVRNFDVFRQTILNNIKKQKNQKCSTISQVGGVGGIISGGKCVDSSGSESSKSSIHADDRPSTSAVAQQQLQQRRSKPLLYVETGETKKRILKDIHKRNQHSTTPPQTSSSDNDRDCFQHSKNMAGQRQIHVHDTLICPSSSEEAISQDVPASVLKINNRCAEVALKNFSKQSPAPLLSPNSAGNSNKNKTLIKSTQILTDEEIDSVFRLHRLNRERDKYNRPSINEVEEQPTSIIKMRLDFTNENKTELSMEKKQELFKTPIIPQKYLSNPLAEYQMQNNIFPSKNLSTIEEDKKEPPAANATLKMSDVNSDKKEMKPTIEDLDGVYHQQHEFCNYLGLTGMSTATAMANAVAELAQCNLARRSMRVLRQQQQERREKSAKEERLLEALKSKQHKVIRKREKGRGDTTQMIEKNKKTVIKIDEGSHSQASQTTTSPKKNSNNSISKSIKSQKSFKLLEKKSDIKRHATKRDEEEKHSSEGIKEITQSVKETLIREAKLCTPEKLPYTVKEAHDNNNEICSKNLKINKKEKIDYNEETPLIEEVENIRRMLRSSILSTGNSALKNANTKFLCKPKDVVQNQETHIICKPESASDTGSLTKSIDTKCASILSKAENFSKDGIHNEHSNLEDSSLFNSGGHMIASAPNIIQQKLQIALEESRKSKPSIFIVQSLESKKENANNLRMKSFISPKIAVTATTSPEAIQDHDGNNVQITKLNKNDQMKVLRTRKGKKYPKRQLRKRKLIVIKTLKPKHKSFENLSAFKRKLRSSLKTNENREKHPPVKQNENSKHKLTQNKTFDCSKAKSYRTVHTETKDLELYLNKHNYQTKTRLMAKATALLERSRRMTLRGNRKLVNKKPNLPPKIQRPTHHLQITKTQSSKSRPHNTKNLRKTYVTPSRMQQTKQIINTEKNTTSKSNSLEIENVVVSSTTNTYDERLSNEPLPTQSPITLRSENTVSYIIASSPIKTKDQITQCSVNTGVHYLNAPPSATQVMRNPLKSEHGAVLYVYYELDILIVIQEYVVSFWKCLKLINMLINPNKLETCIHQTVQHGETTLLKSNMVENCCNNQIRHLTALTTSSTLIEPNDCGEWNHLGELRRLNFDFEISAPYANRICLHNSTPIYLEMRAQQLPKNQRDCNLLSMYINIYYYHDDDMVAKCSSIPLDSIQSDVKSVNYTTLIDSRYFIMTWPQENLLGKTRSGLCKYSLTPQLDTLASIREFKSMRHTIRYLECMSDDKLIGFGDSQVSIWDYRSGDVLMNFDLEIPMGKNLGSIYFSSQDVEQNNMLILHQFRDLQNNAPPKLVTIACTVTHSQPSYRVLQEINLPMLAFKVIKSAIKIGDHLVVTGQNDDELWISLSNPRLMTVISNIQNCKRFYSRERSQLIELTEKTLNINSSANHILQMAAGLTLN